MESDSIKLKSKIKLSFAVITIIPILFMIGVIFCISSFQIRSIENKYNIDNVEFESLINPTRLYSKFTQDVYENIVAKIHDDKDKIADEAYLRRLNTELSEKYSFLIVKKQGNVIFNGQPASDKDLIEQLPDYRGSLEGNATYVGTSFIYGDYKYLVKQLAFSFNDGTSGSAYIVTGLNRIMPQVKLMIIEVFVAIFIIIILTGILLALWINRSVMTPLNKLGEATKKIAEGDLDFTLESESKDEFGALCEDFENMRKRLKESAEDKIRDDEESKELISNISHDLKTPVTTIKGYAEGIMDGVANTPEKMDRYIRTIYNKANEMDRLINELTFYSKIDTNRIPYTFSKIHIADYFDDCVEELNLELDAQHVDLTYFNYLEDDPIVIADAEQIKRVINNIVSNSIKYMDKSHKVINIRLRDVGDFVQVEIEDNGKGIATKDLTKIFDRFYRVDKARSRDTGGTGLGLAIAKQTLESSFNGKIKISSEFHKGTEVTITIPVSE